MSCQCIENINKMICEKYGDPNASIDCGFALDLSQKVGEAERLEMYPAMSASYRLKKKDGSFGIKKSVSVRGEYCPFCGKKYEVEPRGEEGRG